MVGWEPYLNRETILNNSLDPVPMAMPFACIYVSNFPLQALLRVESGLRDQSLAILDGQPPLLRVVALEGKALRAGATLGMTQDQVELLGVRLRRRSLDSERAAHQTLVDCALYFSPLVEDQVVSHRSISVSSGQNREGDWVVLDLRGSERLYGSLENVAKKIGCLVKKTGLQSNIAIAATPEAAILAARGFPGITLIPPGFEASRLENLSVDLLDLLPEHRETLSLWGIRCLGELANLPDIGLTQRLGLEATRLQTLARGGHHRPLLPVAQNSDLQEVLELDSPLEQIEPLLFVLFRLLNLLCTRMNARRLAASQLTLRLELELPTSGSSQGDKKNPEDHPHSVILDFPEPLNNPHTLLKLLHLNLVGNPPNCPITTVSLQAKTVRSLRRQGELFAPSVPEADRLQLTLARVSAIVGLDRAGSPQLLATHRPDTFQIRRFYPSSKIGFPVTPRNGECISPSLRRFRPPVSAQVETHKKVPNTITFWGERYEILQAAGPWRSSGHWWDTSCWCREEWDASLFQKGERIVCRIYYDCQSAEWYVEGLYD